MLRMLIVSSAMKLSPSSDTDGPSLALLGRTMRVTPRLGALLALTAGLLVPASMMSNWPAAAQEPRQSPEFQEVVSVGLVLVPVVIRAGAGYANNLEKKDFRRTVEGKPVAIESFERRSD